MSARLSRQARPVFAANGTGLERGPSPRRFWLGPVSAVCVSIVLLAGGCSVDLSDPTGVLGPVGAAFERAGQTVQGALSDPLNSKPFPVLVGGGADEYGPFVFYATNLGDVRINFEGKANDIVLPGYFGPSNLYLYADKERSMIRPMVPAGAFTGMVADGGFVAYVSAVEMSPGMSGRKALVAGDVFGLQSQVLFDERSESAKVLSDGRPALSAGRIAFVVHDTDSDTDLIRIHDLMASEPIGSISADTIGQIALNGDRLAYVARIGAEGAPRVLLYDVATGQETVVAGAVDAHYVDAVRLAVTDDAVLFSEPVLLGRSRVWVFDPVEGDARVWSEDVEGDLVGAAEGYFVTQARAAQSDVAEQIVVRRYDTDGGVKVLARFRADGLAGQTRVVGSSVVWVNPERKIVLAPLAGGDRTIFKPF